MPTITVRDILRLALPPEARVVAGAAGIHAPVTWVVMMRTRLPAFVDLRGGEIALLSVEAAQQLDPRLTLSVLVQRLAQAPVGAVAVQGTITPEDIEAADAVRLPLIHLPDESNLREIEREVARLISDYEAQMERRGAQLYNVLTQRSMSEQGMMDVLETLADRTGQCVGCYAANGELTVQFGQGAGRVALQSLRPNARGDSSLLSQQIWVEPIGSSDFPGGYVALAGTHLDEWDRLAARQGAAALALVFAREQAVQAAEERIRGDFLSMILTGPPADPAAIVQRGEELGYNLSLPYIALLLHMDEASGAMQTRLLSSIQSELSRRGIAAPVQRRESGILCMIPIENTNGATRPRDLAESLREQLAQEYEQVMVALGTPANTLLDWTHTLKEAEQALALGQQLHLFGAQRVLAFGDLGIYRLLVLLREEPEMWSFYRETLSNLVKYDHKQGGELLKTLEEYFNHLGNLRATSEALHIHRNTLLYRLDRIQQISGMNLEDSEEHFALWLALRAHHVLSTAEEHR
jgi:PucR family transcriptional regulator, purine catabolism regulatory protein